MKISNEIKAGIVIIAGLGVGMLFFAKTATVPQNTYELKTYFTYAGDLQKDAVVKLSGIEAGRLKDIKFVYEPGTKVECVILLNDGIKVREDSMCYIGTSGFVGDAYIGITPGKSETFLKNGDTVVSEDPIEMRELLKKADKIAVDLDNTLLEVKALASNVNGLVSDNRDGINNIVQNLESTTKNFDEFSADLKKNPWKLLFKGE